MKGQLTSGEVRKQAGAIRAQDRDLTTKHEKSVNYVYEKVSNSNLSFSQGLPLSSARQINSLMFFIASVIKVYDCCKQYNYFSQSWAI